MMYSIIEVETYQQNPSTLSPVTGFSLKPPTHCLFNCYLLVTYPHGCCATKAILKWFIQAIKLDNKMEIIIGRVTKYAISK